MRIVVQKRRSGKTELCIQWLLGGHPIDNYPGWSRAIVCAAGKQSVITTARRVKESTPPQQSEPKVNWKGLTNHEIAAVRKAIWTVRELPMCTRGVRLGDFEFVVDDADLILFTTESIYAGAAGRPTFITMTEQ